MFKFSPGYDEAFGREMDDRQRYADDFLSGIKGTLIPKLVAEIKRYESTCPELPSEHVSVRFGDVGILTECLEEAVTDFLSGYIRSCELAMDE